MGLPTVSLAEAAELVADGDAVGTGGALTARKPVALLDAVARRRRGLALWTLLGSLDAELLAARGALAEAHAIYVGFEQLGAAPAFEAAVGAGRVRFGEHSELAFVGGLRAAVAGLPFMPSRGLAGSGVAADLGLRRVDCPYSGERLYALPAIRPDVALIHAEAVDRDGNVLGPAEPYFLHDYDATIARAARRVVVSAERVAASQEARRPVLLFAHEVDAIVIAPGGARPTALPGLEPPRFERLRAYLDETAGGDPAAALDRLLG